MNSLPPIRLLLLWIGFIILLLVTFFFSLKSLSINTQILDLLPLEEQNPAIIKAQEKLQENISGKVLWLVPGQTPQQSFSNALDLKNTLGESGLFLDIILQRDPDLALNYSGIEHLPLHFLTEEDKQLLFKGAEAFFQDRLEILYSPDGLQYASNLESDPLFLQGNYLASINQTSAELYNDTIQFEHNGYLYTLIESVFDQSSQPLSQQTALAELHNELTSGQKAGIVAAGLPVYAAYGAHSAETEISTVGTFSLISIILLMLYVFRSPRQLLLSLLAIGTGVFSGFTFTALIFSEVHIITLVFGSSLMGITIDYAFHYFCDNLENHQGNKLATLQSILPSIFLGMLSSVIAYGILLLTPFPGLQQMAVFTSTGLLGAWLTVVLAYPYFVKAATSKPQNSLVNLVSKSRQFLSGQILIGASLALLVFISMGLLQLSTEDEVRNLQKPKAELMQQDQLINSITRQKADAVTLIIEAASIDRLLEVEASISTELDGLISQERLISYTALSRFYPSERQQKQNASLVHETLINNGGLENYLASLSMPPEAIAAIIEELKTSLNRSMSLQTWIKNMPPQWNQLWLGCDAGVCRSQIQLMGSHRKDIKKIADMNQESLMADTVAEINSILKRYRLHAIEFLGYSLIGIFIILALILGPRSAGMILSIPLLGILCALASLGFAGIPVTVFHCFGLLLALGISLDYAIFQHLGKHEVMTSLAILLSMMTSLLAFGLLSFSETAFIKAFGISLSLGIIYAFVLSRFLPKKSFLEGGKRVTER